MKTYSAVTIVDATDVEVVEGPSKDTFKNDPSVIVLTVEPEPPKRKSCAKTICVTLVAIFAGISSLILCGISQSMGQHLTLLPGGGRDWTIDSQNRIVTSKHNPNLALGSYNNDPLTLTHRYTAIPEKHVINQIKPGTLEALKNGERVSIRDLGLALQFPNRPPYVTDDGEWHVVITGTTSSSVEEESSEEGEGYVTYVNENFLMLNGEYALDVSYWKIEEDNTVNFVKSSSDDDKKTFMYGGGRDWDLNLEDYDGGTISPKSQPDLVLGRGRRPLMLMDVDDHPENVWKFPEEDLLKLQNGDVAELQNDKSLAVTKKSYEQELEYDGWRYINSQVSNSANDVVRVHHVKNNYLVLYEEGRTEDEALVLDVAFWKMSELNSVNFVGGSSYGE